MKMRRDTASTHCGLFHTALLCFGTAASMTLVAGCGFLAEQFLGWGENLTGFGLLAAVYLAVGLIYWLKARFETSAINSHFKQLHSPHALQSGTLSQADFLPPEFKKGLSAGKNPSRARSETHRGPLSASTPRVTLTPPRWHNSEETAGELHCL